MKQSNAASHMVSARDIGAERQSAFGRWRPAPAIRISAAVHLAGVAAVALDPLSSRIRDQLDQYEAFPSPRYPGHTMNLRYEE